MVSGISLRKEIAAAASLDANGLGVGEVNDDVSEYFPTRTSQ